MKNDKIRLVNCKKNISKCYLIGKNIEFFKNQIKGKLPFSITTNLKNTIIEIIKDCNKNKNLKKFVLLSPAAASYDQFTNFEMRGDEFKKLSKSYARKLI